MLNRGIDLNLFYRVVNNRNFKWDIQASYSYVHNEITEIEGGSLITPIAGAEIINIPGEKANSFYGYIYDGVYSTTTDAVNSGLVNDKNIPYKAGDAIYRNLNGDSIINDLDKTVIGSSMPDHWGGLSNTFTFKRWSLHTFVQFVYGNELFNYVRYQNERMTGLENQSTKVLERW